MSNLTAKINNHFAAINYTLMLEKVILNYEI